MSTVYQKHSFHVSCGLVVLEVRPAQWWYLNLNGKISYLIKGHLMATVTLRVLIDGGVCDLDVELRCPGGAAASKGWTVRLFLIVHDLSSDRRELGRFLSTILIGNIR